MCQQIISSCLSSPRIWWCYWSAIRLAGNRAVRAAEDDGSELVCLDFIMNNSLQLRNRFFFLIESTSPELACPKGLNLQALICMNLPLLISGNVIQSMLTVWVVCACLCTQLHQTLCDPMDCSPPGSSVCGISQERILEWVAVSYSKGSSQPRDQIGIPCISCIGRLILYHCATWEVPLASIY